MRGAIRRKFGGTLAQAVRGCLPPMILDDVLAEADFSERHTTRVAASPPATLAAAKAVTAREVPAFVGLLALRTLSTRPLSDPILAAFERMGFAVAGASGQELVVVGIGQFWRPSGGLRPIAAGEFADFDEPGYVKTAFNFHVEPDGDGTLLATETRLVATDASARRAFRRYWLVVRPGSGAIRRAWLRAIKKRAEA